MLFLNRFTASRAALCSAFLPLLVLLGTSRGQAPVFDYQVLVFEDVQPKEFVELSLGSLLPCTASQYSCVDAECDFLETNATVSGIGFYRTTTLVEGTDIVQAYQHSLCACNLAGYSGWGFGGSITKVRAESVCTIRSIVFPLPDNADANPDNASCTELGIHDTQNHTDGDDATMGCSEYCNDVVFRGYPYGDAIELPDGFSGQSGVASGWGHSTRPDGSEYGHYCVCRFGNATIEVCENPYDVDVDDESGGDMIAAGNASGRERTVFAVVLAAAVLAMEWFEY